MTLRNWVYNVNEAEKLKLCDFNKCNGMYAN